ncbi:phosphoribosylamine--glycine ligase [Candidatus Woesearchaeota archaeon]|nr:phosphoribosylamine--glycine ligase [Candidatus Woesearchaeota archaeon]
MKKVLIIGSGGREHALGWKLRQSYDVKALHAPGNGGTEEGSARNISIDGTKKENFHYLFNFVEKEDIDMVVVCPEAPLADGIVDFFNLRGYDKIFGPTAGASLLESDKFFSFDLMNDLGIPQADSIKCYSTDQAERAIEKLSTKKGVVIKARGLTAGKGVTVCDSREQALAEIRKHAEKYGPEVLISKRLFGEEFSVFGISDGNEVLPFEMAFQDHKKLCDGDKGPNTGGMGAYGPAQIVSANTIKKINYDIMIPVVRRMKDRGYSYKGFLYAGMMMTEDGPKVIEFNVRFGDPECQPAMMLLKSDLYHIMSSSLEEKLDQAKMEFNSGASCCVVLAAKGYPEAYEKEKGLEISGLEEATEMKNIKVFHAGTRKENGKILTNGGRVLGVTSYSENGIEEAIGLSYEAAQKINILGGFHYRNDIGRKALRKWN